MGISAARGTMAEEKLLRLKEMMGRFGMPLTVSGLSADEIIETTKSDKKMDSGVIRFILLKEVGQAFVDRTVTPEEMEEALQYIFN